MRSKHLRMQVSMPSASTSTLSMPSASMSSLSHSRKVRSAMAPLWIGTVSSSRSRVSTKPPTCWERWRGKPEQLAGEADGLADLRIGGIEPGLADVLVGDLAVALAPDQAGEARGHVLLEAHGLADLADRHARAVVDDGGADGGALAAVARDRDTGSPPRAARARNRRRCRAARRGRRR